jgi:hypothetical protein
MIDKYRCVGCGYCCITAPCAASVRLYPGATTCPQLEWDGERYICGLMRIPGLLGENYRAELYAGAGCCSNLNDWRKDVKKRHRDDSHKYKLESPLDTISQLLIICLSNQIMSNDQVFLIFSELRIRLMKSGYSPEQTDSIIENANRIYKENKSSKLKSFI